jgi:hypothetical protein
MPSVMRRASKILNEYGAVQSELIGKVVVLSDGKAGAVENVWLDELHGLRISIEGEDGRSQPSSLRRGNPVAALVAAAGHASPMVAVRNTVPRRSVGYQRTVQTFP